jgi:hypothetical protein
MNSHNPKTAKKENAPTRQERPAELTRDGMGLPHLSSDAANRPNDSSLEPDQSVDLDETIRKDKEAADQQAAAKRK